VIYDGIDEAKVMVDSRLSVILGLGCVIGYEPLRMCSGCDARGG
jgi:hypothetical protein